MSGEISGSATLEGFSPSGEGAWVRHDDSQNRKRLDPDASSVLLRRTRRPSLRPGIPCLPTFRGRIADCVFVVFLLVSRCSFVVGALVGGILLGFAGAVVGLAGGWIIGRWTRWSLGLRRRGLTHGFVVRMLERGNNDRPKLLESVVETLRGHRLSARDCRVIAAAYGVATRQLQTCESPSERNRILTERDEKVLAAALGRRLCLTLAPEAFESASKRAGLMIHHRSGKHTERKCASKMSERCKGIEHRRS